MPFADAPAPQTPWGHLRGLLATLRRGGRTVWTCPRYVSDHLAVTHVVIPGTERLVLADDDRILLPGPEAARTTTSSGNRSHDGAAQASLT